MASIFNTEWLPRFLIPFFSLSYPSDTPQNPDSFPNSAYFTTGLQDLCLVVTLIAIMAVLRDTLRLGVFEPFARWKLTRDLVHRRQQRLTSKTNGTTKKGNGVANGNGHAANGILHTNPQKELGKIHRSVLRFAEQGWSAVYYTLQWSYGLYVHRNLPTRTLHPTDLWLNYPHTRLPGPLKIYYLTQSAFYIHQVLILNAEARRKDHVQMMTHHVITIFLMVTSYFSNFTRVGCLVMVLMDWCDIFLPMAKMMRYLEISQLLCDMTFGWFLVSWLVTRHVLFLIPIRSLYSDAPRLVKFQWSPEMGCYLNMTTYWVFMSLLLALQVIQAIWFWMICRVAWRVITTGKGASDDRSDDEGVDQTKDE